MRILKNNKGQGLVEYALVMVLIAVAVVAAATRVGTQTTAAFNKAGTTLEQAVGG